jgi:hypothetical protein
MASIYERLAARTLPLVVLAHPSVVTNNPGKGASFYYLAARQDLKSPGWQELVPIGCLAFLGQFLHPPHQHFLGGGFARTFDQFHTPS